eukprot:13441_1
MINIFDHPMLHPLHYYRVHVLHPFDQMDEARVRGNSAVDEASDDRIYLSFLQYHSIDTSLMNVQYVVFQDQQCVFFWTYYLNQNGTFGLLEAMRLYLPDSRHTNRIESMVPLRAFQDSNQTNVD